MAKIYDGKINRNTDWGGDESRAIYPFRVPVCRNL